VVLTAVSMKTFVCRHRPDDVSSKDFRNRLHAATIQKTAIFKDIRYLSVPYKYINANKH
jgi:hypothetical protein